MVKLNKKVFPTMVLALLMAGCASTDQPRGEADQGASAATPADASPEGLVTKPITKPPTPAEIKDFGDRIEAVPEVMYSVVRNTYSIYLGGQFTASYHANDGSLGIVSDRGDKTCTYSAQAELKEKSEEAVCRDWLNQLSDALLHLTQ